MKALKEDSFLVARAVISGLILKDSARVIGLWRNRELDIRPELWLDLYLVLLQSNDSGSKQVAATYAAGDPGRVHAPMPGLRGRRARAGPVRGPRPPSVRLSPSRRRLPVNSCRRAHGRAAWRAVCSHPDTVRRKCVPVRGLFSNKT